MPDLTFRQQLIVGAIQGLTTNATFIQGVARDALLTEATGTELIALTAIAIVNSVEMEETDS